MYIDETGIHLHKTELKALLTFTPSAKDSHLAIVHFSADDTHVFARATDGNRAIQARGLVNHQDAERGEWTINVPYLTDCYKLLGAKDALVLKVSGASLHEAGIVDQETLEERNCMVSTRDAAQTQLTFPVEPLMQSIALPTNKQKPRCATVRASFLSDLSHLASAAADGVDLYFGKAVEDGIFFASEGHDTSWLGRIMGMREEPPETDEGDDRQDDLPGTEES